MQLSKQRLGIKKQPQVFKRNSKYARARLMKPKCDSEQQATSLKPTSRFDSVQTVSDLTSIDFSSSYNSLIVFN